MGGEAGGEGEGRVMSGDWFVKVCRDVGIH